MFRSCVHEFRVVEQPADFFADVVTEFAWRICELLDNRGTIIKDDYDVFEIAAHIDASAAGPRPDRPDEDHREAAPFVDKRAHFHRPVKWQPYQVLFLINKLVNVPITSLATCLCRARGIPTVRARVPSRMSVAKPCTIAQQAMEIVSLTAGG